MTIVYETIVKRPRVQMYYTSICERVCVYINAIETAVRDAPVRVYTCMYQYNIICIYIILYDMVIFPVRSTLRTQLTHTPNISVRTGRLK